jgi:TIR domain
MSLPTVFLSFASEDAAWKTNFINRAWFGDLLGSVKVLDYQLGDNLPFGPLDEWVSGKVRSAAVFVAFISQFYIEKHYPLLEWWTAITQASTQDLIFVPVMLDGSAKQWWADIKRQGQLHELGEDYAYADFTDDSGKPCEIITVLGPVDKTIRRIGELARAIREYLQKHSKSTGATLGVPSPQREANPITVLGHPSAIADPDVASLADALVKALAERGQKPMRWTDRWRSNTAARSLLSELPTSDSIFVQPIGPGDAGDLAQSPLRLHTWIQRGLGLGVIDGASSERGFKTVLWLPSGLHDEAFAAAASSTPSQGNYFLRNDDPETLASWLRAQFTDKQLPEVPILTLEEVDRDDAGRLRTALHTGFRAVVREVISPPPETWTFQGEMLAKQISELQVNRAIVAVHDLNTGTSHGQKEARQQLEQKLGAVAIDVERAVKAAGRKDLRLFWCALIVQKAEYLPWVKYPSPSRFEEWCLLPFAPQSGKEELSPVVRPKPLETTVFRTYLRDWINNPRGY